MLGTAAAGAFTCPVVIKQAEDRIRKAESKPDHADAVRKAKFAIALAGEAVVLRAQ